MYSQEINEMESLERFNGHNREHNVHTTKFHRLISPAFSNVVGCNYVLAPLWEVTCDTVNVSWLIPQKSWKCAASVAAADLCSMPHTRSWPRAVVCWSRAIHRSVWRPRFCAVSSLANLGTPVGGSEMYTLAHCSGGTCVTWHHDHIFFMCLLFLRYWNSVVIYSGNPDIIGYSCRNCISKVSDAEVVFCPGDRKPAESSRYYEEVDFRNSTSCPASAVWQQGI